jgi:hypothetical protein
MDAEMLVDSSCEDAGLGRADTEAGRKLKWTGSSSGGSRCWYLLL